MSIVALWATCVRCKSGITFVRGCSTDGMLTTISMISYQSQRLFVDVNLIFSNNHYRNIAFGPMSIPFAFYATQVATFTPDIASIFFSVINASIAVFKTGDCL